MFGIVPSQRRHMALRATEPGRHGTTLRVNRVSANGQLRSSSLATYAQRRRPGLIVDATMTPGAGTLARAMTAIAYGIVTRESINHTIHVQRWIYDVQHRIHD